MSEPPTGPESAADDPSFVQSARSADAFYRSMREHHVHDGTFDVRFRPSTSSSAKINLGMTGRGRISVEKGQVTLRGRRRFGLPWSKTEHVVDGEHIFNVQRSGRHVYLVVSGTGEKPSHQAVMLRADSEAEAERLAALLPTTTRQEWADVNADLSEFRGRLEQLGDRPLVTPAIVIINIIIFIAMCIGGVGIMHADSTQAMAWGTNFGPLTLDGQWWRLVTSMFVHFGLFHVALNMIVLIQIGPLIERIFGRYRYALLYLFAGLAGSLTSLLVHPSLNSAGASGAIFGVVGGFFAFVVNPRNGLPRSVMKANAGWITAFVVLNLEAGFNHVHIDNAAHVGGLLGGIVMGLLLARPLDRQTRRHNGVGSAVAGVGLGVIGLGAMAVPAMHPSAARLAHLQFEMALVQLPALEKQAVNSTNETIRQFRARDNDMVYLSQHMRTEVVPLWTTIVKRISSPKLDAGDSDHALQDAMKRYYGDRRTQYWILSRLDTAQLMGSGAVKQSRQRILAAKADAEDVLKQMKKLAAARSQSQ